MKTVLHIILTDCTCCLNVLSPKSCLGLIMSNTLLWGVWCLYLASSIMDNPKLQHSFLGNIIPRHYGTVHNFHRAEMNLELLYFKVKQSL